MGEPERLNRELNEILGRLTAEREADHEAYVRAQEAMAYLVVGLERHIAGLTQLVEQAKTRIIGIGPTGRLIDEAPAPSTDA